MLGGLFSSVFDFAVAERDAGREVEIWVTLTTQGKEIEELSRFNAIPVRILSPIELFYHLVLNRLFFHQRYLLQVHSGRAIISPKACWVRWAWGNNPILWYLHGPSTLINHTSDPSLLTKHRALCKFADAILVPSEAERTVQKMFGTPPKKIFVVPSYIRFHDEKATDAQYPVTNDSNKLLFVSRIESEKGWRTLLDAFSMLDQDATPSTLFIAGTGSEMDACQEAAQYLGKLVKFFGPVDNVRPLIEHATIVIIPSRAESFGRVAFEAALLGAPMIISNIPPWCDIFEDYVNCCFFDPISSDELRSKITYLLTHPHIRKEIGVRAQQLAQRIIGQSTTLDAFKTVYNYMQLS